MPPPESLLTRFREEGFVPEKVNLPVDETAEEMEVFEVPPEDEDRLAEAEAAFEEMMGGMDMDGMDMSNTMNMAEGGTDAAPMDMNAADGGTMNMAEGGADAAPMDMNAADSGTMNMAEGGAMDMSASNGAMMGEGGILVTEDGAFDREIVLTMAEWKFSEMSIDVKPGERIKFTVKNGGQIPHEFMFMSMPLMQAVNYRATRADWNLYEHEALFEQALVLPGGEFTFVLQVTQPGSWMFMCMLPYHMQMGMMGQMATQGMAMDM
ncbi:MAG TPA: hypothetical protein ENJ52_00875 [Aliiroseovarius sp.]|nr:hypothetical protein [Aliiroseovarius sp.]